MLGSTAPPSLQMLIYPHQNFGFFLSIFHFKGEIVMTNIFSANLAQLGQSKKIIFLTLAISRGEGQHQDGKKHLFLTLPLNKGELVLNYTYFSRFSFNFSWRNSFLLIGRLWHRVISKYKKKITIIIF